MNLLAIANAIAGRYAGITATNGAATEALESTPTALLPDTVGKGPVILVYPPTGSPTIGDSAIRQGPVIYVVKMLRDPMSVPDRTAWLYAWAAAMQDKVEGNLDLDLPLYVAQAEVTSFRLEIDGEQYAGNWFDLVEHEVTVSIYEQSVAVGV